MEERDAPGTTWDTYVSPHCFGCDTAHAIGCEMRVLELPGVEIRVIGFSDPGTVWPASVSVAQRIFSMVGSLFV